MTIDLLRASATTLTALLLVAGSATNKPAAQSSRLTVEVTGLRDLRGKLGCLLFSSQEGFPDDATKAYRLIQTPITGTTSRCQFADLPPGTYAVMTLHDENANGKADRNLLGIPKEGYGPSNNVTHSFSAPTWDESKFLLTVGVPLTQRIHMKY